MSRAGDSVEGGTNAGWKSPFNGTALPWQCECIVKVGPGPAAGRGCTWPNCYCDQPCPSRNVRKTNLGALRRCPACGTERPPC